LSDGETRPRLHRRGGRGEPYAASADEVAEAECAANLLQTMDRPAEPV
jgi:hypothetical protein